MAFGTKQNKLSLFRYFVKTYSQKKVQSSLVVLASLLNGVFESMGITLLIPMLTFYLKSEGATGDGGRFMQYFSKLYAYLGIDLNVSTILVGIVVLVAISGVLLFMQKMFIVYFNFNYDRDMSCFFYKKVLYSDWLNMAKLRRSHLINIFTNEINFVRSAYSSFLNCLANGIKTAVLLAVSFLISVKLTLIFVVVGFVLAVVVHYLSKIGRRLGDKAKVARFKLMDALVNVLDNLKFIKLMGLEENKYKQLRHARYDNARTLVNQFWQVNSVNFIASLTMVILVAVVLHVGTAKFGMALSQILVLLFIQARIGPVIRQFLNDFNWVNSMLASVVAVEDLKQTLQEFKVVRPAQKHVRLQDTIEFKSVYFSYDNKEDILEEINLKINKGDYISIIGETGSGKTTVLDLILLLIMPTKGKVLIDGEDSRNIDFNFWRKKVAYVGPENYLTSESIRRNLLVAHEGKEVPEEEVYTALKRAAILPFIDTLKDRVDTLLLDKGANLSTGQKQRLNIARALLRNADILIFDEPTNALDMETECLIREEIKKMKNTKTVIVVTHNRDLAFDADKVYEIKNNQINMLTEEAYH